MMRGGTFDDEGTVHTQGMPGTLLVSMVFSDEEDEDDEPAIEDVTDARATEKDTAAEAPAPIVGAGDAPVYKHKLTGHLRSVQGDGGVECRSGCTEEAYERLRGEHCYLAFV